MAKGSTKDHLARVRELYDFDESLVAQTLGDSEIPKSGHGDTETWRREELHSSCFFPVSPLSRVPPSCLLPLSPRLLLAGFDEAGRGALAGPVVVGCVHFPFFSEALQKSVSLPSDNVADPGEVRLHGAGKLLTLQRNVADELPRYEIEAKLSVASDPCPHSVQAASDVPVTDHSSPSTDPPMTQSFNPSMAQSPDHSMTQSLNDSIVQSPDPPVSLSPRLGFLEDLAGLDDSKRLTRRQRENLCPRIKSHAVWGVGAASAAEIDKLGIVPAVSLAARRAYRAMGTNVDLLLCDRGIRLLRDSEIERLKHLTPQNPNPPIPQSLNPPISRSLNHSIAQSTELSFTRGDSRSLHIAAASIIAKVARDQMMVDLGCDFPGYDFAKHKGYGTASHIAALRKLGPSAIHRRSFRVK